LSPDGTRLIAALNLSRLAAGRNLPPASGAPEVGLFESRRQGDGWSNPELLPFSGTFEDYELSFAPDGSLAVFNSQRPLPDGRRVENRKNNLWLIRRTDSGWSETRYLAGVSRLETEESYGTVGPGGRLIFVREGPPDQFGPDYDLHLSQIVGDDATTSVAFEPAATKHGEGDPWFATDGTYVIFTRWDRSRPWEATVDLYITFDMGGRWSEPVPLSEVNGDGTADYAVTIAGFPERIYWKRGGQTLVADWGPLLHRARMRALGATATPLAGPASLEIVTANLGRPIGMAFTSPDTALVTSHDGRLTEVRISDGTQRAIHGVPVSYHSLEAGLFDVERHPDFDRNRTVYLSHAVAEGARNTLAVERAVLDNGALTNVTRVLEADAWDPGNEHYGGRLAFHEGHLFVTVGDRHRDSPAQDLSNHIGKILRVRDDGRAPADNPFAGRAGARQEIWTYGHRNPQGIAGDREPGSVWVSEHGPRHGDELNRIERGRDYGWPRVSFGWEYTGGAVGSGFTTDAAATRPFWVWTPAIAPSGLILHSGTGRPSWRGSFFTGSMTPAIHRHVNRLVWSGTRVIAEERLFVGMSGRVRALEEGPDGSLYFGNDDGLLLRIRPGP